MAIKAKRLGSKKGIKASLSAGGGKFAQRVPEEGIELRFLTEPEEWFSVDIHYGDKDAFPCDEDECVGCDEGLDSSKKWYANAYWPEEERVVVFEMGRSVVEGVLKKYDRNQTVMDRNFEITKEGTGLQTRYYVEPMDAQRIKGLDDKETIDIGKFLEDWLERVLKEEGGEEVISSSGRRRTSKSSTSKRRRPIEEDDIEDDDDDDDDDTAPRGRRAPAKKTTKKSSTVRRRRRV